MSIYYFSLRIDYKDGEEEFGVDEEDNGLNTEEFSIPERSVGQLSDKSFYNYYIFLSLFMSNVSFFFILLYNE